VTSVSSVLKAYTGSWKCSGVVSFPDHRLMRRWYSSARVSFGSAWIAFANCAAAALISPDSARVPQYVACALAMGPPFHSLSPALPVTQTLPAQTFAKVLVCVPPQLGEPSIELGGLLLIPCLGVEATELAVRHREEP